jgi:hypothetical protein
VLPQLTAPVATTGHLIALKVLAGRNQDLTDLEALIPGASAADLGVARGAVRLIQARGVQQRARRRSRPRQADSRHEPLTASAIPMAGVRRAWICSAAPNDSRCNAEATPASCGSARRW